MNYYAKLIEEKRNSSFDEVRKFTYKECLVTILQLNTGMFSGRYTFSITKDGREELSKDVSTTQQEAERKAKREVESVWNEKENGYDIVEKGTMKGYEYFIEEISTPSKSSFRANLKKDGKVIITTHTWDTKEKAKQQLKELADKDPYINNSKEKTNDMFTYLGKRFAVTKGSYEQVRKEVEQTYRDKIAELERKAQTATGSEKSKIESDIRDIKSGWRETLANLRMMVENSKGYYAELIEKKNEMRKVSMFILGTKSYNVADGSEFRLAAKALTQEYERKLKEAKTEDEKKKVEDWLAKKGAQLKDASLKYR